MSEYAGRIAVGVIVVVVVATVFAFELNSLLPANVTTGSTSSSTSVITLTDTSHPLNTTSWFGNDAPPATCGNMAKSVSGWDDGYNFSVYLSSVVPGPGGAGGVLLGSNVCIYTHLQNVDNESTSLPSSESVVVHDVNASNTSVTSGTVFFQSRCEVPPSYSGSFGPNSTGWNCNVVWDTSQPYNGLLPNMVWPDAWQANGTIYMSNSSTAFPAPAPFRFTTSSAVTTTTTATAFSCGGPVFKLLIPAQGGPVFLKVVTNQGSIDDNGTVFVTHTVPAASGASGGTADYCLRLQGNATGYLGLTANEGLQSTGSYNLTLIAGYNQGPGYQGTVPSFTVPSNAIVYVTVSVPSGEVIVVTCAQGGGCTTTTATATTSSGG